MHDAAVPDRSHAGVVGTARGGNFTVSATNGSGGTITYSYVSGPCALVSGATFSSSGAGPCVVRADSAATTNYQASVAEQTVTIGKAAATVTLSNLTQAYTGSPLTPTAATVPAGLTVVWTGAPQTMAGSYLVTATVNNINYQGSASDTFVIQGWSLRGFYQPVTMGGWNVVNTVKGGSTVPLKFNISAGGTERKDVAAVGSFKVGPVVCGAALEDTVEFVTTGGTSLRYDTTGGQFIQNWQTPKGASSCYVVTMTAADGTTLTAYFKTK
jgi:hypothetical protein